jgi:parvulin-like peptidyl-prolyl isomerase
MTGWRRIVGPALVLCTLSPAGCAGGPPPGGAAAGPGLAEAAARAGGGADVSRSQKPEAEPPAPKAPPPLDLPPDRPADLGDGRPAAAIRAVVNGQAILDDEVRAACYQELTRVDFDPSLPAEEKAKRKAEIFHDALAHLVERELVLQDLEATFGRPPKGAKGGPPPVVDKLKQIASEEFDKHIFRNLRAASGIASDEEFKRTFEEHLSRQGLSLAGVRRQWERNFMMAEYLRQRVRPAVELVGHVEMVEYYQKHPEEFQVADSVQWQDLFVAAAKYPARDEARRAAAGLAERLRKGEDIAGLLKQDDGDSSLRNGEGTGRKRGEVRPAEAEAVLFGMQDGQAAVVEIATGFHVVRLVKREHAGTLPFDEKVQRQIRDKLRGEKMQVEIKRYVNDLKRKAVVEYAHKAG